MDRLRKGGGWLVRLLLVLMLLAGLSGLPAAAEGGDGTELDELFDEQIEASGAQELFDNLPLETRQLMDKLGITGLDTDFLTGTTPESVLDGLFSLLAAQSSGPLRTAGLLMGVVLLCALIEGMKQTVREPAVSEVFEVICTLAACLTVLIPVSGCIRSVCEAAESASVFMASYVPVYAGVLITGGQAASAASFQTVVLFAAELISLLATQVLVPLMTISLALGMTGAVTPGMKLQAAGGFLNKTAVWLLGITTTLFTGLLGLQSLAGSAADTLGGRAIKFSLSSFVPVVGGALSEAFATVKGCLGLVKSVLGGFGILSTALIVLPPLLNCILWTLCLSLCGMAADMFELKTLSGLLAAVKSVVSTLIGILAACSLFLIIATYIVAAAGKGG